MKYAWIDTQRLEYPLPDRFELLAVNVTGYGAWRRCGKPDRTRVTDRQAVASTESLHAEVKLAYGSRRIHRELQGRGNRIALRGIERLMRENGIRARQKRRCKAKTDFRHSMPVGPTLLARKFTRVAPNRVWTGVMKRIHTRKGWMHLASVLDQFNRRVVGWSIKSRLTAEIVTDALAMTWFKPMPSAGVIFHKDRGEYASQVMTSGLIEYGMTASMSRNGNC